MRAPWDVASLEGVGGRMHDLARSVFPLNRSLTGDGVRRTLDAVGDWIPLARHEVPSGTAVFDWTVPPEWNVRSAYIVDPSGRRVVDVADSNLHLVGYSEPVRARLSLDALRPHLHSLPEQPDRIPYRTSYYTRTWGFCLAHHELERLEDGEYEVVVDGTLEDGFLSYGECLVPGAAAEEFLVTAHVCHPSLANDNVSGIVVAAALAAFLREVPTWYSYRFIFAPATIGAITWLARNEDRLEGVQGGMVLTCVGDPARLTYKRSRRGDGLVDRAASHVVRARGGTVRDFSPDGGDEKQYCSTGFDLAVGTFMRSPFGEFDGYHTSADDLTLVRAEFLEDTLRALVDVVDIVETNGRYLNLSPKGEPQLGRRGLYPPPASPYGQDEALSAIRWILSLADGEATLLDIAERSGLEYKKVAWAARALGNAELLGPASDGADGRG
jgi:aminopeptidase-like protein